jgi:hypothetical protein
MKTHYPVIRIVRRDASHYEVIKEFMHYKTYFTFNLHSVVSYPIKCKYGVNNNSTSVTINEVGTLLYRGQAVGEVIFLPIKDEGFEKLFQRIKKELQSPRLQNRLGAVGVTNIEYIERANETVVAVVDAVVDDDSDSDDDVEIVENVVAVPNAMEELLNNYADDETDDEN